jgi:hypothetical protein
VVAHRLRADDFARNREIDWSVGALANDFQADLCLGRPFHLVGGLFQRKPPNGLVIDRGDEIA